MIDSARPTLLLPPHARIREWVASTLGLRFDAGSIGHLDAVTSLTEPTAERPVAWTQWQPGVHRPMGA